MTSLCILDAPLWPLRRNMSVQVVPVSLRANISLRSTNGCLQLEPNWTVSFSHPIYTEVFLLFVWLWIIHVGSAQALKTTLVWFPVWTALEGDILTEFTWRFRASEISEVLVPPLQQGLNLDWISCFMTFNSGFFKSLFWDSFKVYFLHMTLLDHSWILIILLLQCLTLWQGILSISFWVPGGFHFAWYRARGWRSMGVNRPLT